MTYCYALERDQIFTDRGQRLLLKIRDNVNRLLDSAGAFQAAKAWEGCSGDTWHLLACLDRLAELGEIKEIYGGCATQFKVYVRA